MVELTDAWTEKILVEMSVNQLVEKMVEKKVSLMAALKVRVKAEKLVVL
jgi:hypothetical protein